MARIVDVDKLVGEDVSFKIGGKDYTMSGDLDVETTFKTLELLQRGAEVESSTDLEAKRAYNQEVVEHLQSVFRQRDPEAEVPPLGMKSAQVVLAEVIAAVGLTFELEEVPGEGEDPPRPSRRSSGSRRSSRSTGSRRKK